jgi:hypothetical protein
VPAPKQPPKRPSSRRSAGLIGLAILGLSLTGCETRPVAVETTTPNYSSEFLDCVADGIEQREMRGCVLDALSDWYVVAVEDDDDEPTQ